MSYSNRNFYKSVNTCRLSLCNETLRSQVRGGVMVTDYLHAMGVGAGFDTKKIVTALVAAEKASNIYKGLIKAI